MKMMSEAGKHIMRFLTSFHFFRNDNDSCGRNYVFGLQPENISVPRACACHSERSEESLY